jgi:predicted nucleotidyltransferase
VVAAEVIGAVRRELAAVEAEEGVRVLYAVESGSRAWGFASADSDYDVRLVYVRRPEWYLSIDLEEKRDVIERQCPGDIDLSGWDVRKALRLFAKSNPPLLEWLDSPVVYRAAHGFAAELRSLLPVFYSPAACLHHYLRMARRNFDAYLRGERVRHKKYFYVLRPLLAARWIEQGRGPVPMLYARLLDTLDGPPGLRAEIDDLLARKIAGDELAEGPRQPAIHAFVTAEMDRLEAVAAGLPKSPPDPEPLNELFRQTLREVW